MTRDEYLYSVGSGEFGEAMDAKLLGTKPGDIVEFDQELPAERFGEDLAGKRVVPGADQGCESVASARARRAFASTASEFRHVAETARDLREKLTEVKERRPRAWCAIDPLGMVDTVDVDLPESLIEDETAHRVRHAEEQAARYGISLTRCWNCRGGIGTASRRTAGTTPCARSRPTSCWEGVARSEELRSRPRSWASRSGDGPGL